MRADLAQQTFDILLHGLRLRDRVASGEHPHLAGEQAKLKGMLGSANTPSPWGSEHDPTASVAHRDREFLGIRYALTCWLDETLIDAGWREWDENKLESALYRTNIRYGNFWEQAKLAESVPSTADAQEAFLLCVMLGFRGELGETPDRLKDWFESTRSRVTRPLAKEVPPMPEKTPESNVPILSGVDAYKKMTQRLVAAILISVPIIAFLIVLMFR